MILKRKGCGHIEIHTLQPSTIYFEIKRNNQKLKKMNKMENKMNSITFYITIWFRRDSLKSKKNKFNENENVNRIESFQLFIVAYQLVLSLLRVNINHKFEYNMNILDAHSIYTYTTILI